MASTARVTFLFVAALQAEARGSELGLVGKSGADARRERVEKRRQARGQESGRQHWFGEYDEEVRAKTMRKRTHVATCWILARAAALMVLQFA